VGVHCFYRLNLLGEQVADSKSALENADHPSEQAMGVKPL
jgi:hypothetical protein